MRATPFLAVFAMSGALSAQVIQPPFDLSYSFQNLGAPPGIATPFGGCAFKIGDADALYLGGDANLASGAVYRIPVTRDAQGHISGFAGPGTQVASAPFIDGGLQFGPGGVLFFSRFGANELGMIRPGSTSPDKIVPLTPLGMPASIGAISFLPAGFPNVGKLKLASFSTGQFATATLVPDGSGTFDVTNLTLGTNVGGGPEGIMFVPPNSPWFNNFTSMIVSEYSRGQLAAYDIDGNGDPILATQRVFMSGLGGAEGAALDPVSGDFVFSTFGRTSRVLVVQGFSQPCGSVARYGQGLAGTAGRIPLLEARGCFARRQTVTFEVSNGLPFTTGVYFAGVLSTRIPIFGGDLLVVPAISFTHSLDSTGSQRLPIPIPDDTNLLNTDFFSQVVYFDPGAPQLVSFSEGIEVQVR